MSSIHLLYKIRQRQFKNITDHSSSWTQNKNPEQNSKMSDSAVLCKKNSTLQSLWFIPETKVWFNFPKPGVIIHHHNSLKNNNNKKNEGSAKDHKIFDESLQHEGKKEQNQTNRKEELERSIDNTRNWKNNLQTL